MKTLLVKIIGKFLKGNWGKILPILLTSVAEGKAGPQAKWVYWKTAQHKTFVGMVLVFASYGLEAVCNTHPDLAGWGCQWSQYLVWFGGVLAALGLADGGTRAPWPETPSGKAPWMEGK